MESRGALGPQKLDERGYLLLPDADPLFENEKVFGFAVKMKRESFLLHNGKVFFQNGENPFHIIRQHEKIPYSGRPINKSIPAATFDVFSEYNTNFP